LLVACDSSDPNTGADLSATAPADLAVGADLGVIPVDASCPCSDLAGFCAGTRLAGTCAYSFFQTFANCFQPAGHCILGGHNFGPAYDWQNGVEFIGTRIMFGPFGEVDSYRVTLNGPSCLSRTTYDGQSTVQFCAPGDSSCALWSGDGGITGSETYDSQTGIFTCGDGTQVDIGAALGGCAELKALLDPASLCDGKGFTNSCQ
jgi:hypothetical protein